MKNFWKPLLVWCWIAALAVSLFGQAVARGTVNGKVVDANGASLAGVRVVVTSDIAPSYKQSAVTNASGDFSVSDVPGGPIMASATTANDVVRASAKATLSGSSVTVVIRIPAGK